MEKNYMYDSMVINDTTLQSSNILSDKYHELVNDVMKTYTAVIDPLENRLESLQNEMYIKETLVISYKDLLEILYQVDKKSIDNFYVRASEDNYIAIGCYDDKKQYIAKFDISSDNLYISKSYSINIKNSTKHTDTTYIIADTKDFEKWILKIGVYNFIKDLSKKRPKPKFDMHDEVYYIDPNINQYLPPKFAWDILTEAQKIEYYANFYSQYILIGFVHGIEYCNTDNTYIYTIVTNRGNSKKDLQSFKLNENFIAKEHKELVSQLLLNKIGH